MNRGPPPSFVPSSQVIARCTKIGEPLALDGSFSNFNTHESPADCVKRFHFSRVRSGARKSPFQVKILRDVSTAGQWAAR